MKAAECFLAVNLNRGREEATKGLAGEETRSSNGAQDLGKKNVVFFFFHEKFYIGLTSQTIHAHGRKTQMKPKEENKDGPQSHHPGINTCMTPAHLRA